MKRRLCDFIYPIGVLALGFLFGQRLGRLTGYEYFRPVKNSALKDPSRYLFDEVRIFCWVATMSPNHKKKAYFQMDTWGRQCNKILFVSNATDEKLPILLTDQNDNFLNLFLNTRQAFLWIYKNVVRFATVIMSCAGGRNDGSMVQLSEGFYASARLRLVPQADDDTYFHMPNLRHFLKGYSPKEPLAFGHQYSKNGFNYHSGGSGYVLSQEAVLRSRLGAFGFGYDPDCDNPSVAEDVYLGRCLVALNSSIVDASDENGAYRFIPIGIWDMLNDYLPSWLNDTSKSKAKANFSCCSPHFISMNYAKGDYQYFMDYLLHTLKAYGLQYH